MQSLSNTFYTIGTHFQRNKLSIKKIWEWHKMDIFKIKMVLTREICIQMDWDRFFIYQRSKIMLGSKIKQGILQDQKLGYWLSA